MPRDVVRLRGDIDLQTSNEILNTGDHAVNHVDIMLCNPTAGSHPRGNDKNVREVESRHRTCRDRYGRRV